MKRSSASMNPHRPLFPRVATLSLSFALLGATPAHDPREYLRNEPKLLQALEDWYQSRWLLTNGRLARNRKFDSGSPLPRATLKLLPRLFEVAESFPLQRDIIAELVEYGEDLVVPTTAGFQGRLILGMPTFLRGYLSGVPESKTYELLRQLGLKNSRNLLHKANLAISRNQLVSPTPIVYRNQVFIPPVNVELFERPLSRDFYFGDVRSMGGPRRLMVSKWSVTPHLPTIRLSDLRKL